MISLINLFKKKHLNIYDTTMQSLKFSFWDLNLAET